MTSCAWPYHQSRWPWRTDVMAQCQVSVIVKLRVFRLSLMPQIQWIMAQSLRQNRRSLCSFGPHVMLPQSIAEWTKASHTLPRIWWLQGSTLIFKVTCPFGQVRFEIHLSCMRCHLFTNPNPCRNMGILQFCAAIFNFSPVPSDKWHCKTTCPRSHFQHFYLSWTVGQPLRSGPGLG